VSKQDEPIGLAQAAEEFGIARRTLSKAAADGLLKARKTAGAWIVTRTEVERYISESKPKMGRPPGKKTS
jgi:predicted site-specific integrase-resolvase